MTADPAAVAALDRPELAALWAAARRRLERNGRSVTTAALRLEDLGPDEVDAICLLLARRRPASNEVKVSLAALDRALRASAVGDGVVATLEAMSGPVRDRQQERADARVARDDLWSVAFAHPAASSLDVREWLMYVRRRGRLTRVDIDDPQQLLLEALDGLGWLVAERATLVKGPLPLSVIAAVQLGDGHALDPERPLGALVADGLRFLSGQDEVRAAWAAFGVQLDRVNSSVLTLMLPGAPGSLAHAAAAVGEPLRVTHRMLDIGVGLELAGVPQVWVCENPAILSLAADRLGTACRPLVCLDGMPATVATRLLQVIHDAGVELRVHTDLDAGGIAIMSHLVSRFDAEAWRMGADDYLAALNGPTVPLPQRIAATAWDPRLADAMNDRRLGVHEEALFGVLLADLDAQHRDRGDAS